MNVKEIINTTLNLVIFCVIVGFLLSGYNMITKDKILANQTKDIEDAQMKLLAASRSDKIEEKPIGKLPTVKQALMDKKPVGAVKVLKNNKFVGYVVLATTYGYSSNIIVMYSLSPDYKIDAVEIVSQNETPGLGTRIEENVPIPQFDGKPFVSQFEGKSFEAIRITGAATPNPDSIAAITGATISSKAVVKAIHDSLETLKKEMEK